MTITANAVFDGEVLRRDKPLALTPNQHYSVTIEYPEDAPSVPTDAWSVLQSLTGTYDGPRNWSAEHDHYIYGSPKR